MLVDGGCQSSTEMLRTPSLLLFEAALDGHPPSIGTRLLYLRHKVLQVGTHMTLTCPLMYQHLSNLAGLYGIRIRSWWLVLWCRDLCPLVEKDKRRGALSPFGSYLRRHTRSLRIQ